MYPDYLGNDEKRELDVAFERIAQALLQDRADFLLGAGMSKESGVPIGSELAALLLRKFFPSSSHNSPSDDELKDLSTRLPFEAIVQAIVEGAGNGRSDLTAYLRSILVETNYELSDAHHNLLAIALWDGLPRLFRLFTTNFDLLLDKAFGARAVVITDDNTRQIAAVQRLAQMPIIYLHGRVDTNQYQITESDIFSHNFKALHLQFRSALNEADAFVFVGYSMSDPDFRSLYLDYRDELSIRGRDQKVTYVVSPSSGPSYFALGKHVWRSRGAVWIPLSAGQFFEKLRETLEHNFNKGAKTRIMTKYNLTDELGFADKVRDTAELLSISEQDAMQFLLDARTKTGGKK